VFPWWSSSRRGTAGRTRSDGPFWERSTPTGVQNDGTLPGHPSTRTTAAPVETPRAQQYALLVSRRVRPRVTARSDPTRCGSSPTRWGGPQRRGAGETRALVSPHPQVTDGRRDGRYTGNIVSSIYGTERYGVVWTGIAIATGTRSFRQVGAAPIFLLSRSSRRSRCTMRWVQCRRTSQPSADSASVARSVSASRTRTWSVEYAERAKTGVPRSARGPRRP
jgi:hypothetical protein